MNNIAGWTAQMGEINLLESLPRSRRPIAANRAADPAMQTIARRFDREYFDGDRTQGYGGYQYDGRWVPVAERFRDYYGLQAGDRVLDIGCAKGFLLHDLKRAVLGLEVYGLDVSAYAIASAMSDVRPRLLKATARALPFGDCSFDLVISINTLHNLEPLACVEALREIERVSAGGKYIQVDSWFNDAQYENLQKWVLTALTFCDPQGWRELFDEAGYTGDYYWTITE